MFLECFSFAVKNNVLLLQFEKSIFLLQLKICCAFSVGKEGCFSFAFKKNVLLLQLEMVCFCSKGRRYSPVKAFSE